MADKPRTPRRTARTFALAFISSLALAAVAASTAGATSIELGPEERTGFSISGGSFTAQGGDLTINCGGEPTGAGESYDRGDDYVDAAHVELQFHGCQSVGWGTCSSSGAPSGTIVTPLLDMDLTKLPEAEGGDPILVLDPVGKESFATFQCGAFMSVEWKGSLIGELTDPGYEVTTEELEVDFVASEDTQAHIETHNGREAKLLGQTNEKDPYSLGLDGTVDFEFEEEIELSPAEDGHPDLIFENPSTWAYADGFTLRTAEIELACDGAEPPAAESGTGEFVDSGSGEVELTFHGCKAFGFIKCTTPGQEKGTIKTNSLPIQLTYLPGGARGIAFGDEAFIEMTCFTTDVVVSGGVLGGIDHTYPGLGAEMTAVKEGEKYIQEHVETRSGEEVTLEVELNGGPPEPASLDMSVDTYFFDIGQWTEEWEEKGAAETEWELVELRE